MIEGMFVFIMGIAVGLVVAFYYLKQNVKQSTPKSNLFDESQYLTSDKKYFTNKSFEDEGGK